MFSDSHAHILFTSRKIDDTALLLKTMQEREFKFILDIGTEAGDLKERMQCVKDFSDGEIPPFIHFSAGIWPHAEAIKNSCTSLKAIESDIEILMNGGDFYAGLGECGLDRFWNGSHADETGNGGTSDIEGEENLFKEQLKMAKRHDIAVIVHSREAYSDTLKCIDEIGWHKGVIHCFSYGIKEAKEFLERGWYISFPGNITFAKTQKAKNDIRELLRIIPHERLLLETDSPYMTPVPFRGKPNTPLYVEYVYKQAADYLECTVEYLADTVYENCCKLFRKPLCTKNSKK